MKRTAQFIGERQSPFGRVARIAVRMGAAVCFSAVILSSRVLWASEPAARLPSDPASPGVTQVPPAAAPATAATEPGSGYDAAEALEPRWYGWQTLATDGAAVALVGLGLAVELGADNPPSELTASVFTLGVAGYALGGPIVHFSQGHTGRGLASLALRVGLPVVLGFGAVQVFCGDTRELCPLVAIPGGLLGILTAIPVDAAVLARDHVPVQSGVHLTPTFYAGRDQFALGLSGAF